MSATLYGRPSKGRRPRSRLSINAANLPAITALCNRYNRAPAEIAAALAVVGLSHPDELGDATLNWSRHAIELPVDFGALDQAPKPDADTTILVRLPEIHHNAIGAYLGGPQLRSALAWLGLRHVSELPLILAEIDDLQRRLPTGKSLGDFYVDTINDADLDVLPGDALDAVRQLRAGETAARVAKATGLPRKLLAALSVEAISEIDGGLPLTG